MDPADKQAQRDDERFLGTIAGHIPAHLAYLDRNRCVGFLNQRFSDALGLPLDAVIGKSYRELLGDDGTVRDKVEAAFLGETVSHEVPIEHPTLGQRWLLMTYLPDAEPHGAAKGVFLFGVDLTERKHLENELRRSTWELTRIEQRERRQLARVLHDELQQVLAAARLELVRVSHLLPGNDAVAHIDSLLRECLKETRSLTVQLYPPVLDDAGLIAGLRWLVGWMEETHHLKVDFRADEQAQPHNEALRAVLFATVRELLFNVVKHSGVHHAELVLDKGQGQTIRVSVRDAGVGFDVSKVNASIMGDSGFGMFAVRERLRLIGGRLEVESSPGRGTLVTASIPHGESARSTVNALTT